MDANTWSFVALGVLKTNPANVSRAHIGAG